MSQHLSVKKIIPGPVRNEKGFALITVLVLSAVLMAVMAMVMNSANMETAMSGASSISKMALARADAGIEYVRSSFVLIGYNDPLNPFDSPWVAPDDPYLPIRNDYINAESVRMGVASSPLNSTNAGFTLKVSRKSNNALLTGKGFSNRYITSSGGGGSAAVSAYPCEVTSIGTVANYRKQVVIQGYNLAP